MACSSVPNKWFELFSCIVSIYFCYLIYGVLQERLYVEHLCKECTDFFIVIRPNILQMARNLAIACFCFSYSVFLTLCFQLLVF